VDDLDTIPGFFNWPAFYDRIVRDAPPGSLVVEVGVFCGRSLAHLARAARRADKGLRIVGVDWFRGDPGTLAKCPPLPRSGNFAGECLGNLTRSGLADDVALVAASSRLASALVPDGAAYCVFVDAAHDTPAVRADIDSWLPKVAPGGVLAGHDADYPSVRAALDARFGGAGWRVAQEAATVWEAVTRS
jgi:predicted O-methyltransferase YrrM